MKHFFALIALSAVAPLAVAQAPRVPAVKMEVPPVIDGIVNDSEWAHATRVTELYAQDNDEPAPEASEIFIAYDENFIYIAGRLFDAEPHNIRAIAYQQNVSLQGDDSLSLSLDVFGNNTDFSRFSINPRGATSLQIAGGRAPKPEWIGNFVAAARITDTGWEVEARIPWELMRLPNPGERDLRFDLSRRIWRYDRTFQLGKTRGGRNEDRPIWEGVDVPSVRRETIVNLLPYAYVGYSDDDEFIFNSGVDFRTIVSDELSVVGTVNPDFRNIERQILDLSFSRFDRIAGESRPFFLEGSSFWNSRLITTQLIDSFDVGLNMHGRLTDSLSYGILNTVDFGNENAFVSKFSYQPSSQISADLALVNLDRPGVDNTAVELQFGHRNGPAGFQVQRRQVFDQTTGEGYSQSASASYQAREWFMALSYDEVSPDYRPRLAFIRERNYRSYGTFGRWGRSWLTGPINGFAINVGGSHATRLNGDQYRDRFSLGTEIDWRAGYSFGANYSQENFEGTVDQSWNFRVSALRRDPNRNISVGYTSAVFNNNPFTSFNVNLFYRPVDTVRMNLSYQWVDFVNIRDQAILTVNYDMGNSYFLSGRAVKRDSDINYFLTFERSNVLGTEFFLIIGDPNARTFQPQIIFKVVTPLTLSF